MAQFEWESSNLHISYPFTQPGIAGLNDVIVDAVVIDTQQSLQVCLRMLDIVDWDYSDILGSFTYSDDTSFFAGSPSVEIWPYGQWVLVRFFEAGKEIQLILDGAHALPISITGRYPFVARVQECDPKSISSIQVTDGETSVTYVLTGDIYLEGGYNVQLQQVIRSGTAALSIGAQPGSGLGLYPSQCTPSPVLRSFNSVRPDAHGHFVFNATDCYRMIIPTYASPDPAIFNPELFTLQLWNDCSCCCPCDAYENVYKAIKRQHDSGQQTGLRLARTIDDFNDLRNAIASQKSAREIPTMDLFLRPSPGYIVGAQINILNSTLLDAIYMNTGISAADAYIKMQVQVISGSARLSGTKVYNKKSSPYVFNSVYGNPWEPTDKDKVLTTPQDFTDPDGIGIYVSDTVVAGKNYHIVQTTQFVTVFFELVWPTPDAAPADGDIIQVTLTSDVFKPYTITKQATLQQPYTGTIS
jgi:hypothetical protein